MHIVKRELGEAAAGHYEVKCKRGGNTEAEPIRSREHCSCATPALDRNDRHQWSHNSVDQYIRVAHKCIIISTDAVYLRLTILD